MGKYTFLEIEKGDSFDPLAVYRGAPFTQAKFYGDWQEGVKRKVRRFTVSSDGKIIACFQLIKYALFGGTGYFYAPYGPVTGDFSEPFLLALKSKLENVAKEDDAAFIRLDFTPPAQDPVAKRNLENIFVKAPRYTYRSAYFQPRTEWFLGLKKSEKDLFLNMHKKNRYSVRLAEKAGVTAEIVTENLEKYFGTFYELMAETAKRNGFGLHPKNYYENVFRGLRFLPKTYLAMAKHQNKILVVDLIVVFGKTANYVFGGSSNDRRNLCPSYPAQLAAIYHAKRIGCADYNFGGVSSASSREDWDGLTRFKKRFGGREVAHSDFFDIVVRPIWYRLYCLRKFLKSL